MPKVDVTESWQRGNHPVFVFSSLLAQRQFSATDFALAALNHPAATNNFRTTLSVEQPQKTPWYQVFPIEFFSDNFALTHLTDRHVFNYRLVPSGPDSENPGTLTERGRNFRSQAQLPQ